MSQCYCGSLFFLFSVFCLSPLLSPSTAPSVRSTRHPPALSTRSLHHFVAESLRPRRPLHSAEILCFLETLSFSYFCVFCMCTILLCFLLACTSEFLHASSSQSCLPACLQTRSSTPPYPPEITVGTIYHLLTTSCLHSLHLGP